GLGGGLPIGACVGIGGCGSAPGKGDHGRTLGGKPVARAAPLALLDTIERGGLPGNARKGGGQAAAGDGGRQRPPGGRGGGGGGGGGVGGACGRAAPAAAAVEAAARRSGFLVNAVQPDAIRLAPPLVLTPEQADSFIAALPEILASASVLVGQVA